MTQVWAASPHEPVRAKAGRELRRGVRPCQGGMVHWAARASQLAVAGLSSRDCRAKSRRSAAAVHEHEQD